MPWKSSTWVKIQQNVCLAKQIATFIHFKVSVSIFKPLSAIWDLCLSAYEITSLHTAVTCHGISVALEPWNCWRKGGNVEYRTHSLHRIHIKSSGFVSWCQRKAENADLRTHGPVQNSSLTCFSLHPHKYESSCFSSKLVWKRNCYCHDDE